MKIIIFLAALTFSVFPSYAYAANEPSPPPKTVVRDQNEAALLLGKHLFTESYISQYGDKTPPYTYFGDASIADNNGLYEISGLHENYRKDEQSYIDNDSAHKYALFYENGGYIKMSGQIKSVDKQGFTVSGTIEYYETMSWLNEGLKEPPRQSPLVNVLCRSVGDFLFSRKNHPKYWRLQNREDICECEKMKGGVVIDLFTAQLKGTPPHGNPQRYLEKERIDKWPPELILQNLEIKSNPGNGKTQHAAPH